MHIGYANFTQIIRDHFPGPDSEPVEHHWRIIENSTDESLNNEHHGHNQDKGHHQFAYLASYNFTSLGFLYLKQKWLRRPWG